MSSPDTDPANVPPIVTREFNRIVAPLMLLGRPSADETPAQTVFSREPGQDLPDLQDALSPLGRVEDAPAVRSGVGGLTQNDRELYVQVLGTFPSGDGEFARLIRSGNFASLHAFAGRTALRLTEQSADAEEGVPLTIPRAFAIHALVSVFADAHRPRDARYSQDRTTYFLTQFASELAQRVGAETLDGGPDAFDFVEAVSRRTALIGEATGVGGDWLRSKFVMLADKLLLRKHMLRMAREEPTLESAHTAELRAANDQLFAELQRLRRYSIKSAAHTEGGVTWSIHDMFDVYTQMAASSEAEGSHVHPDRWQPRMVMMATEDAEGDNEDGFLVRPFLDAARQYRSSYDDHAKIVWMDERGELYADMHGAISWRQLYEQAGKPGNYEPLRQFLLQKYFDLTVPVEIVRTVEAQTRQFLRTDNPGQDRQSGTIYHDLLLPRIRVLRQYRNADELDALDTAEDQTLEPVARPAGKRRQHDIEAHRRLLPEGYRPSDKAIALAAELGIPLGPGETVVKKHKRGDPSLGEVAHRAKSRRKTTD